jgi:hypothetical protein
VPGASRWSAYSFGAATEAAVSDRFERPLPFEAPPSYVVEIAGRVVSPTFDYGDEEEAHQWVARHHPTEPYTLVTIDGLTRRVTYQSAQQQKLQPGEPQ